jgi:hypothetical protein
MERNGLECRGNVRRRNLSENLEQQFGNFAFAKDADEGGGNRITAMAREKCQRKNKSLLVAPGIRLNASPAMKIEFLEVGAGMVGCI